MLTWGVLIVVFFSTQLVIPIASYRTCLTKTNKEENVIVCIVRFGTGGDVAVFIGSGGGTR